MTPQRCWRHQAATLALACVAFTGAGTHAAAQGSGATTTATTATTTAPPVARRPVEHFARLPLLSQVTISPNGRQIAALMNVEGRTLLISRATEGGKPRGLLTTDNKEFHFNWIHWVNDERVLASLRFASRRDFVGTTETRLLSVKADGSGVLNLVRNDPLPGSMNGTVLTQQFQDRVIDWLPQDGQHILLQLSEPGSALPGVYKVNVETGQRRMVKAPERYVYWWMTDGQGRVRVGVRLEDGVYQVRVADVEGKNWRVLWTFGRFKDEVWPIGFGRDPHELYVRADHDGRMAIFSVRLDQPELPRTLRLAHPKLDVDGRLMRSPVSGEVLGVLRGGDEDGNVSEESRAEFWDPAWRAQARAIDQGLPRRENLLLDMTGDEQRYVVHSSGNGVPGEFYVGDRKTGELALLGAAYPEFDVGAPLVGKHAVTIKARDGLTLNAYLTLPQGRSPGDGGPPLPMVLFPHGGPQARDDAGFDPWTEFLADRGYLVLQVNFRGSDGYGHQFKTAGLKRWGLEMQDDLSDGVAWAIAQQLADPARVCIVGASYGGYAALMGAVKTPELYRCVVSFAGVSDLPDLISHESQYIGGREAMERMVGRVWGDRERLRATSPARHAERIRAPVLLVHGTVDRSVPVEQSADMARALKRAGKAYRYIEQEGGDHHLSRYEHRLEFFKALELFLDQSLKAPAPVSTAAAGR